ncbi:hypothetical protein VTN00DRAFT_3020 [Thermoascus crustaceus]|uniref:uncharacterized protein n=1 Tax=Thermoascus crustaceus TaxID=5088 RepID=UPI003742905C
MSAGKSFDVAIVGGGIGGLCLAVGLLRHGVPVTIYEAAPAFAEIGAGVAFGPNATKAMSLIGPDLRAAFDACATNNWSEEKKDVWFDFRLGQVIDGRESGEEVISLNIPKGHGSVHRAHFLDQIVKLVPSTIAHFGKRLVSYDDTDDGVVLKFDDGTTARHTALVGCDGIKSQTRKVMLGEGNVASQPTFSGKYAYRGLIPMEKACATVGDQLARNSQMYMGRHGHVLTFPVDQGRLMNVVAFRTNPSTHWPSDLAWVKPVPKETMLTDFSTWNPTVKSILSLMTKTEIWALFDHPPASTYTQGQVCLLGDAAHATTPHQGAGAGMAVEDALVLSTLLGMAQTRHDVRLAFSVYDEVRRPRTQRLVSTSRQAGRLYDMELEGVGDSVDEIRENVSRRMEWIWGLDVEGHVRMAGEAFVARKERMMVTDVEENADLDTLKETIQRMKALISELKEEIPSKKPKVDSTPASTIKDINKVVLMFGLDYHQDENYIWDVPAVFPVSLSPEAGNVPLIGI